MTGLGPRDPLTTDPAPLSTAGVGFGVAQISRALGAVVQLADSDPGGSGESLRRR